MKSVFLKVCDVHKRFAGVYALRGISFQIEAGKIYHLLGENGCGKSTLIKIISGAQPADGGHIEINGIKQLEIDPLDALKLGIQTVYQDLSLIPNLSVAQNISLSSQLVANNGNLFTRLDLKEIDGIAKAALDKVNLPCNAEFLRTPVELLPIATRQLVAIARAVASDARLVIMDEPTTSLTQKEVENLISVVNLIRSRGVAIIFVTHKLDECYSIGGEVIVFRDGQLIVQGNITDFTKSKLAHLMTGREIDSQRMRKHSISSVPVFEVCKLSRAHSFEDINFTVHKGEILGITGLLDSGRNELALALSGVAPSSSGTVSLEGKYLNLKKPYDAISNGIAYVPEDRIKEGLFLDKPIRENIIVSSLHSIRNKFGLISSVKAQELALKTVSDLQIATPDVDRNVQLLSGGNQQRVLIGRWLAIKPKIIILHGPTVGVDVGSKETIYKIIQTLSENGVSIILISDDLPELLMNCDRILLMKKGKVKEIFDAKNLEESNLYKQLIS
jgi:simple sugar transport system ATP-binding protein